MNLAVLLHGLKPHKHSALPLPLAPTYTLPHHRCYFSSPALVPLRKRPQNTSFLTFLDETTEQNANSHRSEERDFICFYESEHYMPERMAHIFEIGWQQAQKKHSSCKAICDCGETEIQGVDVFRTDSKIIGGCIQQARKATAEGEEGVNWYDFSKRMVESHLNKKAHHIAEERLSFYRLPSPQCRLISIVWSNNYLLFDSSHDQLNPHMKAKAVEFSQQLAQQLQIHVWQQVQPLLERAVADITNPEETVARLKKILAVSSFKLWVYKKPINNEIYLVSASHITFAGLPCILYDSVTQHIASARDQAVQIANNYESLLKDYESVGERTKEYSQQAKSVRSLRGLKRNKLQELNQVEQNLVELPLGDKKIVKNDQYSETICACCRDLLLASDIPNEITAKHIDEIRYLKQMKIGKPEYNPYDFVTICPACYALYIQHRQTKAKEAISQKENQPRNYFSTHEKPAKRDSSLAEIKQCSFIKHKSKERLTPYAGGASSKRINRSALNISSKMRAKSELNNSRESKQETITCEDISKDKSIQYYQAPFRPPRPKKATTSNTSNTEHTLQLREEGNTKQTTQGNFILERSLTQQEKPTSKAHTVITVLPKSNSMKTRTKITTNNIINRILQRTDQSHTKIKDEFSVDDKSLAKAISEYQTVERPSFKKLLPKNNRHLLKEMPKLDFLEENNVIQWKKKSIQSHL